MSDATGRIKQSDDHKEMNTWVFMKKKIPGALREQVWILYCGDTHFKHKCLVTWCENIMTPFNFEVGHNIPESKGGRTDINNLRPICAKCNRSMADDYTIDEFSALSERRHVSKLWECFKYHEPHAGPPCFAS
jgi:5-methylcytosine-specific restriction endonuclease McrA